MPPLKKIGLSARKITTDDWTPDDWVLMSLGGEFSECGALRSIEDVKAVYSRERAECLRLANASAGCRPWCWWIADEHAPANLPNDQEAQRIKLADVPGIDPEYAALMPSNFLDFWSTVDGFESQLEWLHRRGLLLDGELDRVRRSLENPNRFLPPAMATAGWRAFQSVLVLEVDAAEDIDKRRNWKNYQGGMRPVMRPGINEFTSRWVSHHKARPGNPWAKRKFEDGGDLDTNARI